MAVASAHAEFLRYAVLRYDGDDGPAAWQQARDLLAADPGLADRSIYAAAVLTDPVRIRRHLSVDPGLADRPGGPLDWPPLLYLTYARVRPDLGPADAQASLSLLLDAGADPNAGFLWSGEVPPFTALTGLLGSGEQGETAQPAHPQWRALAEQLLTAGADANDGQGLYNRMFSAADDHLELLLAHGLGRGDGGPWRARLGDRLDAPVDLLRAQLIWAVTHGFTDRVRLLARHGVDLSAALDTGHWPGAGALTPVQLARRSGQAAMVALLIDLGARAEADPGSELVAALLAGDRATSRQLITDRPGLLAELIAGSPSLVLRASVLDQPEAVRLLVESGFDLNALGRQDLPIEQRWETALHHAAGEGRLALAQTLLELGADPSVRDRRFDATPLDWARHLDRGELVALLEAHHGRDDRPEPVSP